MLQMLDLRFEFADYYPCGGWDDFVGSFDTVQEAMAFGSDPPSHGDRYQIVDLRAGPGRRLILERSDRGEWETAQ